MKCVSDPLECRCCPYLLYLLHDREVSIYKNKFYLKEMPRLKETLGTTNSIWILYKTIEDGSLSSVLVKKPFSGLSYLKKKSHQRRFWVDNAVSRCTKPIEHYFFCLTYSLITSFSDQIPSIFAFKSGVLFLFFWLRVSTEGLENRCICWEM